MKTLATLTLTLALLATTATAQPFRCDHPDGSVTYQDTSVVHGMALQGTVCRNMRPQPARPAQDSEQQPAQAATTPTTPRTGVGGVPPQDHAKMRDFCARRWQSNFRMRNYCMDQQTGAWAALSRDWRARQQTPREETILLSCLNKWMDKDGNGFDWNMTRYCWDQQITAARNW